MRSLWVRFGAGRLLPPAWPSVPAGRQSQLRDSMPAALAAKQAVALGRSVGMQIPVAAGWELLFADLSHRRQGLCLGIHAGHSRSSLSRIYEQILSFKPGFQGIVSPLCASGDPRALGDSCPGTCARQRPGFSALVVEPGAWGRLELRAQLQVVGVLDPAQGPCHLFVRRAALLAAASALQLLRATLPLPSLPCCLGSSGNRIFMSL